MKRFKIVFLLVAAFLIGFTSCQKEDFTPVVEEETALGGGGAATDVLESALAVAYDPQYDNYYVVGETAGQIDVFYGYQNNWTKLQENRDIDNRYAPGEFVDFSIGLFTGKWGNNYAIAVGNKNGQGTSINGRGFSDKPYFGDGAPKPIGALTEVLAVDYDQDNDIFIVVGKGPGGAIDVYHGYHDNWAQLQENRDIDNRYAPTEFVDFAIGLPTGKFGNNYGIAVGNKNGQATSINCREFYDKPWFGDGNPQAIGDLVEVLSVDYDQDNDLFVVVGKGPGGDIDVYHGYHNDWTKLQENRDIDNRYSANDFVGFAIGLPTGKFGNNYGIAVGNDDDYKIGWRTYAPRATSINCREFYDKPWFGDGKPAAIQK